ncbi:ATP-binding cassette domain-containing protein [Microbacterium hominis]|uniref:ATP-binding cassette domain-containing protein n=1 Tax=Microbacterium hominis TaxID=162426 RepID=UPI0020B8F4FE|nr:ATP-binding cassette domain-containing protein [Microbacterium hominis]
MTAADFATSNVLAPVPRRDPLLRRLLRNPMGAISMSVLLVVAFLAVFGPLLAPIDPNFSDARNILGPPSGAHILGTDPAGRDVWSRLLTGAQLTIAAALLCVAVSLAIGVPAGLLAGYYGGVFDRASGWASELLMSLPGMIVLLAVRAALGPSVWIAMGMLGILISPAYFRLVRAAVRNVRNELYVDAARVSGLSDRRIIARHIVYVVRAPIIIQTAMILGLAIAVQSGLQFLGLGDALSITWGSMLGQGFDALYRAPLLILWPALAIGATVGAAVLFANALRDALEDTASGTEGRRRRRTQATSAGAANRPAATAREEHSEDPSEATEDVAADAMLCVSQLAIAFEQKDGSLKRVVDGVSLSVRPGEVVGLVGESGSGKTQTAFAILGLLAPEAEIVGGAIVVDGTTTVTAGHIDRKHLAQLRGRRISYIPQEPMSNLDPNFTIGSQLSRPMVKVLGISRSEAKRRALELLARVGIVDPEKTYASHPHEISGAWRSASSSPAPSAANPISSSPTSPPRHWM